MKKPSNSTLNGIRAWIGVTLLGPISLYSQISLNGIVIKPNYAGSQSDLIDGVSVVPAVGKPLIRHVYAAGPNILAIVIDEQALIPSELRPYRPKEDDKIVLGGYHGLNKILERNGDPIAYIAGRNNEWYRLFNELAGESLDLDWVSDPRNFSVVSSDDSDYGDGVHPVAIFRKTVPRERVTRLRESSTPLLTHRHYVFLELRDDLTPGSHYRVHFKNSGGAFQEDLGFHFNDRELRSEAIHVNLYGYEPKDKKIAFLSSWMGDGGGVHFPEGLKFRVVDLESNQTVYEGEVQLRQRADTPEYRIGEKTYNHNKADVWEMDFSSLRTDGHYKLMVNGIGCSFDFLIESDIWENTARLLMKGFLHQRAGIELGPPYTDYIRPRNMHPADGQTIHKLDPDKFFGTDGRNFERIQASLLEDTSVPEAWGGWMDAGDFDRRMTHFYSVRRMMYLCEQKQEYFEGLNFNIPESSNTIPDILDEALWCLDLFRRTQGVYEEGAVSWQVESVEHPRYGETSWLNSLPTALLPPSPQACIEYIGTAAHMALLLEKYDKELAAIYRKSVLDAVAWLGKNPDAPDFGRSRAREWSATDPHASASGRAGRYHEDLAYLNLYRLTGDEEWHSRFRAYFDRRYPEGVVGNLAYDNVEVVSIYALMESQMADSALRNECRTAIIELADELLAGAEGLTYKILRVKNEPLTRLVPLMSKILPVVTAHILTGNEKYTDALTQTIQYTMGANPLNRSFISGLGEHSNTPYQHDWHADSLPLPAGIPNFGPTSVSERDLISQTLGDDIVFSIENEYGLYPSRLKDWPMTEACFEQTWIWPINEFMVETPMGELLLLTAYLADE